MPRRRPRLPVSSSHLIAFAMGVALVAWVLSGALTDSAEEVETAVGAPEPAPAPGEGVAVQVRRQEAEPVTRLIVNQGEVLPNRVATVRAEIPGRVVEIGARRGARVEEGAVIVRLDVEAREARLEQARAQLAQAEQAYEAAERLAERGFEAEIRLGEAFAELQTARAQLRQIEIEIEDTTVRAPFEGVLNERPVELGEYVAANEAVAEIVDLDPLIAVARVSQGRVDEVALGMEAAVELATGAVVEGTVSYISAQADEETRTFRVEVDVPNPDASIPAGISAEVRIPVATVSAHFISPALLSLSTEGVLGIKTIDDHGRVAFHEVDIVRSEANGIWVTGLPETVRLITAGQGFVQAGEVVEVVQEEDEPATAGGEAESAG